MKIIFLDIDGVITSARTGWMNLDIYATSFLKWVCEQTDTKIVISSTWRCNRDRKFFADIFGEELIHKDWKTPWDLGDFNVDCRGDEIQLWLNEHSEITDYLIIDDDSDMLDYQISNLIKIESYNGLMFDEMMEICDRLAFPDKIVPNMNLIELIQHPNMFAKSNTMSATDQIKTALGIKFT